jgi:hypothetical protein
MARIRTIKPEFFVSEQVADVSPTCRLLFVGMWLFCDDAGIHPASSKQLKMEVLPGDDVTTKQVGEMVKELLRVGLLVEYEVDDGTEPKTYWQVTGWHHQKIERPRFQYPPPDSATCRRHIDDTSTSPRSPRVRAVPDPTVPDPTVPEHTSTSKSAVNYPTDFEEWWKQYPKKVQKLAAAKAYKSACQRGAPDVILAATIAFSQTDKARGDFCPYPATWLNENRWEDDPTQWQDHGSNSGKSKQQRIDAAMKDFLNADPK